MHMTMEQVLAQFGTSFWYKKPNGRDFQFKTLKPFITDLKKKCDGRLIHIDISKIVYDDLMLKYERVTVDFITQEVAKNPGLAQSISSISRTDKNTSKALGIFSRDPLAIDTKLDEERTALGEHSSKSLLWLQCFLEESLLFRSNEIFDEPLVALVSEELRRARSEDGTFTWTQVKDLIRKELVDLAPRGCLETLQTILRSDGIPVARWTSTFTLLDGLVKDVSKTELGPLLKFGYWDGQVTHPEWKVMVTAGFAQPKTDAEKEAFNYAAFLEVAKKQGPKAFKVFHSSTPEVAAHCATLLRPPGSTNRRTRATPRVKKKTGNPRNDDRYPYTCHDCGIAHTGPNQHTADGSAKIHARFLRKKAEREAEAAGTAGAGLGRNTWTRQKPAKQQPGKGPQANDTCGWCQKKGHWQRECKSRLAGKPKKLRQEVRQQEQQPLSKSGRRRARKREAAKEMAAELKRLQESNSVERADGDGEPVRKRQAVGLRPSRFPLNSNLLSKLSKSKSESDGWLTVTSKTTSKTPSKTSNTASKTTTKTKTKSKTVAFSKLPKSKTKTKTKSKTVASTKTLPTSKFGLNGYITAAFKRRTLKANPGGITSRDLSGLPRPSTWGTPETSNVETSNKPLIKGTTKRLFKAFNKSNLKPKTVATTKNGSPKSVAKSTKTPPLKSTKKASILSSKRRTKSTTRSVAAAAGGASKRPKRAASNKSDNSKSGLVPHSSLTGPHVNDVNHASVSEKSCLETGKWRGKPSSHAVSESDSDSATSMSTPQPLSGHAHATTTATMASKSRSNRQKETVSSIPKDVVEGNGGGSEGRRPTNVGKYSDKYDSAIWNSCRMSVL